MSNHVNANLSLNMNALGLTRVCSTPQMHDEIEDMTFKIGQKVHSASIHQLLVDSTFIADTYLIYHLFLPQLLTVFSICSFGSMSLNCMEDGQLLPHAFRIYS